MHFQFHFTLAVMILKFFFLGYTFYVVLFFLLLFNVLLCKAYQFFSLACALLNRILLLVFLVLEKSCDVSSGVSGSGAQRWGEHSCPICKIGTSLGIW